MVGERAETETANEVRLLMAAYRNETIEIVCHRSTVLVGLSLSRLREASRSPRVRPSSSLCLFLVRPVPHTFYNFHTLLRSEATVKSTENKVRKEK